MSGITRWWCGSLLIVALVAPLGPLVGNAVSQEEHEEAQPIVVKEEAPRENPFASREGREREERERGERPTERDILKQQVEVFKIALHGLQEAEKRDAADVLQRAIRAREIMLEGRRDDEAHMIRERAPSREHLAKVLAMAAGVWREFNNQEKAAVVGRLAEQLASRPGDRKPERERGEERPRERTERPTEREIVMRWIEVMKMAMPALREAERDEAVELLERAIRGYEVGLEGRRDEEAQEIRQRMPSRGQQAEILTMASRLWREFENEEKAVAVGRVAEQLAGRPGGRKPERREEQPRERTERPTERDIVLRRIEVMKTALPALREGERGDAVEILEHAIRAYEVGLEGRRDDEAHKIRERMPKPGHLAEALTMASNLWREFKNQEKAAVVGRLAKEFAARREREPERERAVHRGSEAERDALRSRLQELEDAFLKAREAGKEDEAARLRHQMEDLVQRLEGRPARRPAAKSVPREPGEVEHLRRSVHQLQDQMAEMRRQMAEMQQLLKALADRKEEDR